MSALISTDKEELERLRAIIEKPYTIHWWGYDHEVRPAFVVEECDGDGKKLMLVQPLSTRPQYYVVRGDSETEYDHESIENLLELIEDAYGYEDYDEEGDEVEHEWPYCPSWSSCGFRWDEYELEEHEAMIEQRSR